MKEIRIRFGDEIVNIGIPNNIEKKCQIDGTEGVKEESVDMSEVDARGQYLLEMAERLLNI